MKWTVDSETRTVTIVEGETQRTIDLYSLEAFQILSEQWLKVGWTRKYHYSFSWMGQRVIQIPEDLIRFQEVVYRVQPDVILETGVGYGGSLLFSASLCKALGKGRVIGVDIDIRPPNRRAIENHILSPYITLIEGNSIAVETIDRVKSLIVPHEKVIALFDSNHTKHHVLQEMEAYADLIPSGSYLIVADGFMKEVADTPRGKTEWAWDNPCDAACEFVAHHPDFEIDATLNHPVSHWPGAWIKKR